MLSSITGRIEERREREGAMNKTKKTLMRRERRDIWRETSNEILLIHSRRKRTIPVWCLVTHISLPQPTSSDVGCRRVQSITKTHAGVLQAVCILSILPVRFQTANELCNSAFRPIFSSMRAFSLSHTQTSERERER